MNVTATGTPTVLVLMGVSGSGKSTLAGLMAGRLGWDLGEGDSLHPESNVQKMASGTPLDDDDRWPWLDRVAAWIDDHIERRSSAVITCSALKRTYRDALRRDQVVFVHLTGPQDTLIQRLSSRIDHYMPASLLRTQLDDLEPPEPDENALTVDVSSHPTEVADTIERALNLRWAHTEAGS